jgi:hypothetical protein
MSNTTQFTIGTDVVCSDGSCGVLKRVVIDPVARSLTHLAVGEPRHKGDGRLVPIGLVESAAAEIRLRCTHAEFEALEPAEETQFLPRSSDDWRGTDWGYGQGQALFWPFFSSGGAGTSASTHDMGSMTDAGSTPRKVVRDRVPVGEVEVRRGEHVHATDGTIGHVHGLIVDPADHHVTHILLGEGHLWGKKEVAIPIGAVEDVTGGIRLTLTRNQVRDLPAITHDGGV